MSAQPLESRIARLEGLLEQIDKRIGDLAASVNARFGQVDDRFAQIDARFAQVDSRIDGLNFKIDGLQWRMTSLILATWITTIVAILLKR